MPFLDYSGSIDLLVLPRISSKLSEGPESTRGTSFLSDVVRVSSTTTTSNMSALTSSLSERRGSLGQCSNIGTKLVSR